MERATIVFAKRANGPHASQMDTIIGYPTIEEIGVAQAAVKEVIGEKGSEKRFCT